MASIRTFKNIQDEVLAWLDEAGDTDVTLTLVKQAIRAAHEKRLSDERWAFMLASPRTFATVVGRQTYMLDENFLRLLYVKNLSTPGLLREHTDQNVLEAGYDWTVDTDSACRYTLWGHSEVKAQPTSASVVAVSSSNSGDNGTSSVTIAGETATGWHSETILCNASGALAFTEIAKVTKSDGWIGTMTLTTNAGVVTNLTLGATEYGKSYQPLYLLATPNSVETIEYRYYRQPSVLVSNNDRPDYPSPFEELCVWDTLCDVATYNSYSDSMVAYWMRKQSELLSALQVSTNQAQTINQAATYTQYIPR